MKAIFKRSLLFLLLSTVLLTSCRKEETESIQTPDDETLQPNSVVSNLMLRTASNDGSNDNIIDYANCISIQLPVTVIANGIEITVNTTDDYDLIESLFDEDEDDTDTIVIIYPITIVLSDFSEVDINNASELYSYTINCNDENESDDDIECIDFQYPITASVFNSNNELIETIDINSDNELYNFIENIDDNDIITINFPITVTLSDGTPVIINSLNELAIVIEDAEDDCDEDDDYDYNDDDCDNCTPNQLEELLINCPDWEVDKLENDNTDYDDLYDGYLFNFFSDGTVSVFWDSITVYGTWSTSGSGNNIIVTIDIPSLPYCNNNWSLHEIEMEPGETKVDLRVDDEDRLRYENDCN